MGMPFTLGGSGEPWFVGFVGFLGFTLFWRCRVAVGVRRAIASDWANGWGRYHGWRIPGGGVVFLVRISWIGVGLWYTGD